MPTAHDLEFFIDVNTNKVLKHVSMNDTLWRLYREMCHTHLHINMCDGLMYLMLRQLREEGWLAREKVRMIKETPDPYIPKKPFFHNVVKKVKRQEKELEELRAFKEKHMEEVGND